MAATMIISRGFKRIIADDFFRPFNLRKGRLLVESQHVSHVQEVMKIDASTIYACCLPQMMVTSMPYRIAIQTEDLVKSIWFISLGIFMFNEQTDGAVLRTRRDVFSFSMMVSYKTGRSALEFNNYGRFCGLFGSGSIVDKVDQCCSMHDKCYTTVISKGGVCNEWGSYAPFWIRYTWLSQPNGTITCVHENLKSNKFAECAYIICECDKDATNCFARNAYNPENKKTLMWRVVEGELVSKLKLTSD